jgi:hypothetical protein
MSAYVVGFDHVDAMLTIARRGAAGGGWGQGGLRDVEWWRNDPEAVDWRQLEKGRITVTAGEEELTAIGRMLLEENERSVAYRYPDDPAEVGAIAASYRFRTVAGLEADSITGFGLVACLRYQSCEHPEWKRSEAFRFCEGFERAMIRRLPGMDSAPWHYERGGVPA